MPERTRVITFTVPAEYEGRRLDSFVRHMGYTGHTVIELKKHPDGVLLNGRPVWMIERIHAGDRIDLRITETENSPHIDPVPLELQILYEDEDLMVINKPAGMPTHPSMNHHDNTLANGLAALFAERGEPFVFRCPTRLDRDTSGLTIIAKHYAASGILSDMASRKEIRRHYLAVTGTAPDPANGVIDVPLGRRPGSIIERIPDPEHGETAVTAYRTLFTRNGCSLLLVTPETGRTHQIRVHLKTAGCPIIGDYLYNPDMKKIQRQALHSYSLFFRHPITGQPMHFCAPLPTDMRAALGFTDDGSDSG